MFKKYSQQIKSRQEFRRKILDFINTGEEDPEDKVCGDDLTKREKEILKYYYYIKFGIDTEHIAEVDERWISNILNKITLRLKQRSEEVNMLLQEVKVKVTAIIHLYTYIIENVDILSLLNANWLLMKRFTYRYSVLFISRRNSLVA